MVNCCVYQCSNVSRKENLISFHRFPNKNNFPLVHQQWYKKTGGVDDGVGSSYEWKILTLFFLRMIASNHEFELASNLKEAGLFDDIVVRYRKYSIDPWQVLCMQLKHKRQSRRIFPKSEFLGLFGDLSLVRYCASYTQIVSPENKQFVLFTNASVREDLIDELESDGLLNTGGKTVSFKVGGEVYRELCDWVDFKETLTEVHGQVVGLSDKEVEIRLNDVLTTVVYQNKAVKSYKDVLLKSPTLPKLKELLKKLESVSDKETYSSFLAKLQVYSDQANESELDDMIKELLARVWFCSNSLEMNFMFHGLQKNLQFWWKNDDFYLTPEAPLWLEVTKSQADFLSKSTIDAWNKTGAEFESSSLELLANKILRFRGISNLRVDSRTAASSLKVHQALARFGARDLNVLYVNVTALLAREDDVLSAWATRWCPVLVVECDDELDLEQAARIGARVEQVVARDNDKKLLVLIAPEKHALNVHLSLVKSYSHVDDNSLRCDLTEATKLKMLSNKVTINGKQSRVTLSEMVRGDMSIVNAADSEVVSQMLTGDFAFGKRLEDGAKFFVQRSLRKSDDGVPFVVNSVRDVPGKVVLVVAEPGMGKTTLLTHLANSASEDPRAWVVHVKLNDSVRDLAEIDPENESSADEFLERSAVNPCNSLEKLVFLSVQQDLVVFVDGVDEVCPRYQPQVFSLLVCLRKMDLAHLWVASRPAFEALLEGVLRVTSLHLVALSALKQREICNEIWKVPPRPTSQSHESLFTWLTDSLGKNNFLGVPLMATLVAEAFQDELAQVDAVNGEFHTQKRLDFLSLYKTFVKKKLDLYFVEKKKAMARDLSASISDEEILLAQFYHNYRLASLRVLFSHAEISKLKFKGKKSYDEDVDAYLRRVSDGRDMTGIIHNVNNGVPNFVHRSFAEYFAATWLAQNFSRNRQLIERILFDPAYSLLSEMFHRSLAEDSALHVAVLNRDVAATKSVPFDRSTVADEQDEGGRTPLHLAVLVNGTDRHQDGVSILRYLVEERHARVQVFDFVLAWEPLRYAERCRSWDAVDVILARLEVAPGEMAVARKSFDAWSEPDTCFMLDAAQYASVRVVRYLADERCGVLECRGSQGETMVHRAAAGGNVALLEWLTSRGHRLDVKDDDGNTALRYTSLEAVTCLLEWGLDLEGVNAHGLTALQAAADNGAYNVMAVLLGKDASPQANCSTGGDQARLDASLLCAAFAGNLPCVKELIRMGASGKHRDKNGHSATWAAMHRKHFVVMDTLLFIGSKDSRLHAACGTGEVAVVAYLLSTSADGVVDVCDRHGQTPLVSAIRAGHEDVVKLLLAKGAVVDFRDELGRTALHKATLKGEERLIKQLIRHGADVNVGDREGRTSLLVAVHAERWTVVETLLACGADATIGDQDGRTPLETASSQGNEQAVAMLLLRGADVNGVHRRPPIHAATRNNHVGVVRHLLERGASVDCRDGRGWTPLIVASMRGHCRVAEVLLEKGADVHAEESGLEEENEEVLLKRFLMKKIKKVAVETCFRNACRFFLCRLRHKLRFHWLEDVPKVRFGRSPLFAAVEWRRGDVVALLMRKGACHRCRDNEGRTPLHVASAWGSEEVVDVLLGAGADCDVKDYMGRMPLDVAEAGRHSRVIALLDEASLTYTVDAFRKWRNANTESD